ncbi:hypothetical protein NE237_004252 [Protea cynaroides]|uniref:Uncharacterized protein n=1 Tax=Protea cynaroides TaxID=273540 RepID=A0A9Q0KIC0_9MAGN|nr:hypothetical protein NE237_004252 [Protea cynaroides]
MLPYIVKNPNEVSDRRCLSTLWFTIAEVLPPFGFPYLTSVTSGSPRPTSVTSRSPLPTSLHLLAELKSVLVYGWRRATAMASVSADLCAASACQLRIDWEIGIIV